MVDLGCQDTDWVEGNDKDVFNGILLQDGLTLATFGMDKGKCGDLGCIFGCIWALRGGP